MCIFLGSSCNSAPKVFYQALSILKNQTLFLNIDFISPPIFARIDSYLCVSINFKIYNMASVTYKNQPAINRTKGNVPLAGTSHVYTISKKLWHENIEETLQNLFIGTTLHVCCGKSLLGDVRIDLDKSNNPDFVCDAANMKSIIADNQYDTVLCDPPYNGNFQWNHDLLLELSRVASQRIIFQHWFIPANPNGLYKKAQEKFELTDVLVWQPKTYFGRVNVISVFDRIL